EYAVGRTCPIGSPGALLQARRGAHRLVDEPWKVSIEQDRAAIDDGRGAQFTDGASHDAAANRGAIDVDFHLQLQTTPRQQTAHRFEQHPGRRHVDDNDAVARAGARASNPMAMNAFGASSQAAVEGAALESRVDWADEAQSGFHWRTCGSNARIRVFPVSPYTRTTSCFVAPRTYRLPDDDVPFALNEA